MPLSSLAPAPLPVPTRRAVDSDRRRTSASAILRSVLAHGPVARSTIARLTGLSPASVTDHCNRLTALGLIQEAATLRRSNGVGRPHVPVDLDDSRFVVGGVHVAVPYTTVALLDLRGRVVAERRLNHGEEGGESDQQAPPPAPAQVLADASSGLRALLAAAPDRVPLGVGVATGGWVDRDSGTIVEHPLLGWRDVRAREVIHALTGLPVHVDGHARALVNGERLFGRTAGGGRSLLHLFVGNVVDAAFATHDEVHHGPRSQSGAIAHLPLAGGTERCDCGRTGCLQAELSERTLCRRAREAGVVRTSDPMHVLAAAADGDPVAVRLLLHRARMVGRAAGLLLDVLNPDTVVVTEMGAVHREDCLAALREEVGPDRAAAVVPTSFPDSVLAVAGGSVALDVLYRDPLSMPSSTPSSSSSGSSPGPI
ncbi:ROK family transcriptional regulator [Streptomyces sp. ActVer]|uniref:ROK family transcriptional regulator n=1 Tax=Streptomyces sp. ActVer TaxID=3014558 RepID=UPI0022B45CFB|nr:ROK family transcriptional regulator [Streptomyces sp. ActVer]MCZ4509244.1 ROK family transcriptional regulator [Streptomyces sp. ActVer]